MPKPTLQNRRYFKSVLQRYRDKFTSPIQKCQLSDIDVIFSSKSNDLVDQEINVLLFGGDDYHPAVDISSEVTSGKLHYIPALAGDYINLKINSDTYQLYFNGDDSGATYNNQSYGLNQTFTLGSNNFTVKALGGALLEVTDGPTYDIAVSSTEINEGESVTFTITAENVTSGTELYYTISGDVSADDFDDNTLSGSFAVIDFGNGIPSGAVTKNVTLDLVTEGDEDFVFEVRTGSTSGPIVATSSTITIIDIIPTFTITQSATSVNEGESVTFTLNTVNVNAGTTLHYNTSGTVSAEDFSDGSLTGLFNIVGIGATTGIATITRTLVNDFLTEGTETFTFIVRTGSTSGPIVATSQSVDVIDVIPTFTITPSASIINEGESVTFNVTTTDVPDGAEIFFSTIGSVTASDFSDNSLTGSFAIINFGGANGIGAFTRTTLFDFLSESNKDFQIQLRLNSASGNIVGTSSNITINNISPTFAITPSTSTINEGQSVTFTISTNVPNGTVLYYTTLGDVSASEFSDNALSGSVTISNQTATIVKTTLRDRKTEGDEQFAIQLRLNSVTGNVIATSSFVKIKDTSRNIGENANNLTFGPIQVNRDNGNTQLATDWYKICNIDELPPGSKIALFIDTSGSMTQATIQASYDLLLSKLSEKNITIITVTNPNEDWITPFLTELN
jgi:hypothetical protein